MKAELDSMKAELKSNGINPEVERGERDEERKLSKVILILERDATGRCELYIYRVQRSEQSGP